MPVIVEVTVDIVVIVAIMKIVLSRIKVKEFDGILSRYEANKPMNERMDEQTNVLFSNSHGEIVSSDVFWICLDLTQQ
jgi:hypothetical protein